MHLCLVSTSKETRKDWATTLRECTDLVTLRNIHSRISSSGQHRRVFLGNLLIQTYARCGSIEEADAAFASIKVPNVYSWTILIAAHIQTGDLDGAREVFDAMPGRDVVAWNSIIGAYARGGRCGEAICLFGKMDLDGVRADNVTFLAVADACSRERCLDLARVVHEIAVEEGLGFDSKLGSAIVNMYGKCGEVVKARLWLNQIQEHTVVVWTAMLTAYAQNGHFLEAMEIFKTMPEKNVVSWNAILSASSQEGDHQQAVEIFYQMLLEGLRPSTITMISVLDAAASMRNLAAGARAHAVAIDSGLASDTAVANALIHLYGECGLLETAEAMFAALGERGSRDTMSWNIMIGARARVDPARALATFFAMELEGLPRPSLVTYVSAIHACGDCANVEQGRLLHGRVLDLHLLAASVVLATAVVTMYARCGRTAEARAAFDGISAADDVAWTAMLAAYSQNGQGREALAVLAEMDVAGIKPSAITYISAVEACSCVGSGEITEIINAGVVDGGFESDPAVASALVHAYGRCAALPGAIDAFRAGPRRDAALWNALITAFAGNELAALGAAVFREMVAEGVAANEITFVSVMCCCGHAGLVEDVRSCFVEMSGDHGVIPGVDHYACLVDVLGRAGRVAEAEELMEIMPLEPDSAAWTSFLDACRGLKGAERGRSGAAAAAANALVMDPHSSGPYILLCNMQRHLT